MKSVGKEANGSMDKEADMCSVRGVVYRHKAREEAARRGGGGGGEGVGGDVRSPS